MTDYAVKRSYRGEVLVAPEGAAPVSGEWRTSKDRKRYFYTSRPDIMKYRRTSKAGEHLKGGGEGLANWKAAMAAIGTVMSDSARSEIATLINEYDGDPYYAGDDDTTWRSGKRRLMDAVEYACKVAGRDTASTRGSEFHKLGEIINQGRVPLVVQPHLEEHLAHYRQRVAPIKFIAQEILVINDALQRAGSVDYLFQLPAGVTTPDGIRHDDGLVCAGDLKTGKWDVEYPAGVYAQLAGYGLGVRYNQETNERSPLHPNASDRWAVLVHYPIAERDAQVDFYWIDMHYGLAAAKLNSQLDTTINFFKSTKGRPIKFEPEA